MVQVLPYVQSPLEQLMPHINQAAGQIGQGFINRSANLSDQRILEGLAQNQNATPMDQIKAFSALSSGKQQTLSPLFTQFMQSQQKQAAGVAKKEEVKGEVVPSLDRLEELTKRSGGRFGFRPALGKLPFTPWNEERKELDTLGIWAADKVYTHFNKGVLNEAKWNDVKDKFAPKAELSDRENMARINAMRRIMNLPAGISSKKLDGVIDQEQRNITKSESDKKRPEKNEKGKKLTSDVLEKWKKEGLSREQSEARAKELGYEF